MKVFVLFVFGFVFDCGLQVFVLMIQLSQLAIFHSFFTTLTLVLGRYFSTILSSLPLSRFYFNNSNSLICSFSERVRPGLAARYEPSCILLPSLTAGIQSRFGVLAMHLPSFLDVHENSLGNRARFFRIHRVFPLVKTENTKYYTVSLPSVFTSASALMKARTPGEPLSAV